MRPAPTVPRRRARALVALLGVVALAAVPLTQAAAATGRHDQQGRPVLLVQGDDDVTRTRVVVRDVVPGSSRTVVLRPEPGAPLRSLRLAASSLVDDDHGCLRPEVRAGDTTCGAGGGELSSHLVLQLVPGVLDAGDRCRAQPVPMTPTGRPTTLAGSVTAPLLARARGTGMTCALLDVAHVDSVTDNLTQGDTVTFDLLVQGGSASAGPARPLAAPEHTLLGRLLGRPLDLRGARA